MEYTSNDTCMPKENNYEKIYLKNLNFTVLDSSQLWEREKEEKLGRGRESVTEFLELMKNWEERASVRVRDF